MFLTRCKLLLVTKTDMFAHVFGVPERFYRGLICHKTLTFPLEVV